MRLNGEELEEGKELKYLGSTVWVSGEMEVEVSHMLNAGKRIT